MQGGIYKIVNKINGKAYIGMTMDFALRESIHRTALQEGKHFNISLQKDFLFYGESNFIFEIIEYATKNNMYGRERFWINHYGYEQLYNVYKRFSLCKKNRATKIKECFGVRISSKILEKRRSKLHLTKYKFAKCLGFKTKSTIPAKANHSLATQYLQFCRFLDGNENYAVTLKRIKCIVEKFRLLNGRT